MDTSSSGRGTVAPGTRLAGRYELHDLMAAGGMAQVWRSLDLTLDRWVAIKILHGHLASDPTFVERFRHEARSAARLNHRSIVAVYDTVSEYGIDAIVMELVRGVTLHEHLAVHGRLRAARAVEIAAAVADGLDTAHEAGIVHRDVKPANVMLSDDGRVLVTDFGIAKAAGGSDLTDSGGVLGTAKYVAPEQVRGEPTDPRTDIYALGAMLYEMLAGAAPFEADTEAATALARLHRPPGSLVDAGISAPVWLDSVVARALALDPDDRFADAAAMAAALRRGTAVEAGSPLVEPDDSTTILSFDSGAREDHTNDADVAAPRRPGARAALAMALLLAAMGAGVAMLLFTTGPDPRSGAGAGPEVPLALRTVAEVGSFDPFGTGTPGENDSLAPLAVDGDPTTEWHTEGYSSADMGSKPGVGYRLTLADRADVSRVDITTTTDGWSAEVYAGSESPASLEEWGSPIGRLDGASTGPNRIEVATTATDHILVWFTELAAEGDRYRARISEIDVFG